MALISKYVRIRMRPIAIAVYDILDDLGYSDFKRSEAEMLVSDLCDIFLSLALEEDTFGAYDQTIARLAFTPFVETLDGPTAASKYKDIDRVIKYVHREVIGNLACHGILYIDDHDQRDDTLVVDGIAEIIYGKAQ